MEVSSRMRRKPFRKIFFSHSLSHLSCSRAQGHDLAFPSQASGSSSSLYSLPVPFWSQWASEEKPPQCINDLVEKTIPSPGLHPRSLGSIFNLRASCYVHGAQGPCCQGFGAKTPSLLFSHFYQEKQYGGVEGEKPLRSKWSCPEERVLDYVFFYDLGRMWFKQAPGGVRVYGWDVLCLPSGLPDPASRSGAPPAPMLSVPPNVCHLHSVWKYGDCGALHSSGQSLVPPNSWSLGLCAQTGPAVQVADRLDRQLRVRSQTDGGITWVREAGRRPTQDPPSGKALALAVGQSSFFPGLWFHEWWNLLSGESSFFGWWEILQWQGPSTALGWGTRAVQLGRAHREPGFEAHLLCDLRQGP